MTKGYGNVKFSLKIILSDKLKNELERKLLLYISLSQTIVLVLYKLSLYTSVKRATLLFKVSMVATGE